MFLLASHFEVTCMSSEGYVCWNPRYCNYKWINIRPSHHFQIYISSTMSGRATVLEDNTRIDLGFACVADQLVLEGPKSYENRVKIEPAQPEWCGATKSNDGPSSTSSLQNGKETHLLWLPPIPNHEREQRKSGYKSVYWRPIFSFNILHVKVFICDLLLA